MNPKVKQAVEEYQCPGCVCGHDITCYVKGPTEACERHVAGTMISNIGDVFLGLPTGFNRLGPVTQMPIWIYHTLAEAPINMFNVPVWKHRNQDGHVLVRGLMPRLNQPFLYIILEDCRSQLNCLEITDKDIMGMD